MNTPIYDFVKAYRDLRPARFHMPGHKGRGPLGCEELDLTEIPGADSLYEAAGIIAESEANASALFGCPTFYSTEGSSHCIRAMLKLAREACQGNRQQATGNREQATGNREQATGNREQATGNREQGTETGRERIATASVRTGLAMTGVGSFRVLAARNVHRAFLSAAALLDLDVCWLPAAEGSYLSADLTPEELDAALAETGAGAVYLTCPDYLGFLPDLRPLAAVCHAHGALLLVDNAHGAYLRFLTPSRHPMDLGADLCCDSAHKTLPVLTGGAYLHVKATGNRQQAIGDGGREGTGNREQATGDGGREGTGNRQQATGDGGTDCHDQSEDWSRNDKFGNASPSDVCHLSPVTCPLPQKDGGREGTGKIRDEDVRDALALFGSTSPSYLILQSLDLANPYLETLPERLAAFLPKVEALKARLRAAGWRPVGDEPLKLTLCCGKGLALAAALEREGIFCEFADTDYIVFMLSPEHTEEELGRLEAALAAVNTGDGSLCCRNAVPTELPSAEHREPSPVSLREAMLSPAERVPAAESPGRVLARSGVSCPPAVPILMPGERITERDAAAFERYGIETVSVLF